MKRIISPLLGILLIFTILSGCSRPAAALQTDSDKLRIVSTIFPGYDFAGAIAGEYAELTMLLPPGAESHSFEPTPQDIIRIQDCDLFIYVGGEGDAWVDGILDSLDTTNIKVLAMMGQVEAVEEELVEGMEDDHDHAEQAEYDEHEEDHEVAGHDDSDDTELDEHVWTSPLNAIAISRAIADALCEIDSGNAAAYRANADSYQTELEALDADLRGVAENARRRTVVFGDRFPFRYLADEYGLEYYAAFPGCSTETEASAQTVAFLIDKVEGERIPAVFHIEFSNERMADTICESTGAKKLLLHSCHNVTKDEFDSDVGYLDLMYANVDSLKEALN